MHDFGFTEDYYLVFQNPVDLGAFLRRCAHACVPVCHVTAEGRGSEPRAAAWYCRALMVSDDVTFGSVVDASAVRPTVGDWCHTPGYLQKGERCMDRSQGNADTGGVI